jgi:hypothetical protein
LAPLILVAHTQLTGSLIAATDTGDKDGNDNGQLNLTTNSLNASSLNTTTNNKSNSIGLNAGGFGYCHCLGWLGLWF